MKIRGSVVIGCTALIALAGHTQAQQCDPMELTKLLADDGTPGDGFGRSVAVSGNVAIIGAPTDEGGLLGLPGYGSAYIFRFDGTNWVQEIKLQPDDDTGVASYGISVAIDGDIAVVGSYLNDTTVTGTGAVYIYRYDGMQWTLDTPLFASDAAVNDNFGISVDISGETVVVGAQEDDDDGTNSGSAYVFAYNNILEIWEETKLTANDADEFDEFGYSVAIDDTTIVVGAYHDENKLGDDAGSIYIFDFDGSDWNQTIKLQSFDGEPLDEFGSAVDVDNGVIVAGARNHNAGAFMGGAAYVYQFNGTFWTEAKLEASDPEILDRLGGAVAISGDSILAGAEFENQNGAGAGAAYLFRYDGTSWAQDDNLIASDGDVNDHFGVSVALSQDNAIVGAVFENENGNLAGAAYAFDLNCPGDTCLADLTGDGSADFLDISAFISAYGAGEPLADLNNDGEYDFLDISLFLGAYSAGCP